MNVQCIVSAVRAKMQEMQPVKRLVDHFRNRYISATSPRGSLNGGATFALCSSYQLASVRNFDDRSYFHRELVACGIEVFMTLQFINRVVESIHFSTLLTESCEHHTLKDS